MNGEGKKIMNSIKRSTRPSITSLLGAAALLFGIPVCAKTGGEEHLDEGAGEDVRPFREIGLATLGRRGEQNGLLQGVTVFDANGDGLLDIYLPHDGRPFIKKTTADGVLMNENIPALPGTLFLNQGSDSEGEPIFRSVQELISLGNETHVKEELLIENKYKPRTSIKQDEFGVGRIARGAVAADFDGDGRVDLYVLNAHHGMWFQTEETGVPIYSSPDNLGRGQEPRQPIIATVPPFMHTNMADGLRTIVDFSGSPEWEGQNVLYLNKGDSDNDGIPEWENVTQTANIGGRWDTAGASVADVDRDGDLDVYVANFLDIDFSGFGMNRFAGNRNQLYINQLVETGKLVFVDRALEMKVSGLHNEEELPNGSYIPAMGKVVSMSKQKVNGEWVGEEADHSWSAMMSDWNDDGWPDLVVTNDIGGTRLRVYEGRQGRPFERDTSFDALKWEGGWMGARSDDLDGDGYSEILVSNSGTQSMTLRNTSLFIETSEETNNLALAQLNYLEDRATLHHALLSYTPESGIKDVSLQTEVKFSGKIPPDVINANNMQKQHREFHERTRFADSLAGIEFSWGPVLFDVENDGDLDVYFAGAIARGNDGFFGDATGSPGRLLINNSLPGKFSFTDKTLEYQILDMLHLEYGDDTVRRPSPGTGWHKRDYIYLEDTDSFSEMGLEASKNSSIRDIYKMHEAAYGMIEGDLNNDGFSDLVVTHFGAYDSLSPNAKNLKVNIGGRVSALPGTDKLKHPPRNYDPGRTFIYINGGSENNWVKIGLRDRSSKNLYGVGAKVVVNDRITRRLTVGGASFSHAHDDLLVGLGSGEVATIQVTWPSGDMKPQTIALTTPVRNRAICIDRQEGVVECR